MAASGVSLGGGSIPNRSGYPMWNGMQESPQSGGGGGGASGGPSSFPPPVWTNPFHGYPQHQPSAMQYPPPYRPSSPMMNQGHQFMPPPHHQLHPNAPGPYMMMPPPHMTGMGPQPTRSVSPHPHSPMMDSYQQMDQYHHNPHHNPHPHQIPHHNGGWSEKYNPPHLIPPSALVGAPYATSEPKRRKIEEIDLTGSHVMHNGAAQGQHVIPGARRMAADIPSMQMPKPFHASQSSRLPKQQRPPSPSKPHKPPTTSPSQSVSTSVPSRQHNTQVFHKNPPPTAVAVPATKPAPPPPSSRPPSQSRPAPATPTPSSRSTSVKQQYDYSSQQQQASAQPPSAAQSSARSEAVQTITSTTTVTPALKAKMLAIRDDDDAQLNSINEDAERQEAERALAVLDLTKASMHIGKALVKNTKRTDLVDRLISLMKTHKSDILVAVPNQPFHRSALQSFIYARLNRLPEALVLLLLAFSEYCRVPIFSWLFEDWTFSESALDEAIKRMPMDALRLPMLVVLKRHPQIAPTDVSLLSSMKPFAKFMYKVFSVRRAEFDSNATYFLATTLRKAGDYMQGLKLLEELHQQRPSWKTCIGIGYILREMGELEKAIDWFENASSFNPPNISFLLDAADTSLRVDQIPRARAHYLSILNAQPENAWADASVTYISFLMSGSEEHFGELLKMATKGNKRAKYLLKDALDVFKQYRVFLPDPCDCFVSAMQELRNYEYRPASQSATAPEPSQAVSDAMDVTRKISSSSGQIVITDTAPSNQASYGSNTTTSTFDIENKPTASADASASGSVSVTGGLSVGDLVSSDAPMDVQNNSVREPESSSESGEPESNSKMDVVETGPGSGLPDSEAQERIRFNLAQAKDRQPLKSDEVRVAVSAIEAPAYTIVWRFLNKIYSMNFRFEVELLNEPMQGAPDPRVPAEQVAFLSWKYSKIKPRPGLPAPKLLDVMRILQPISTIARSEFDVSRWMRQSERISADILIPAFQVIEEPVARMLLGLMLHAEDFFPLPETWGVPSGARHTMLIDSGEKHAPVWTWIYSIFIVITMVAASTLPSHLEENSLEAWRQSLQYKTLHSLLMGPMDWVVDAAIIVLARIALDRTKPAFVEQEVCRLFLLRAQKTPTQGYVCYRKVLLCHLIMLPSVRPDQRLVWIRSLKKQM